MNWYKIFFFFLNNDAICLLSNFGAESGFHLNTV